jgi:succinyl-diaminopimelate desuccinylase
MLIAAQKFILNNPDFTGSLGFLITSGEEGDDYDKGTPHVMTELAKLGIKPNYCIVGEPSSTHHTGDVIKIGRRGSLNASLTLHGKQGHVAYPHLAENPIHLIAPALAELSSHTFDQGNGHFPPTSLQITQIESGSEATNIIPGELKLKFNIRYSTEQNASTIKATVLDLFKRHNLILDIIWRLSGEPFLTSKGCLLESCIKVIKAATGQEPELSTSGGTSDGRFIAPFGVEVIELGPVNATIHQVNECVSLADLHRLTEIYYHICEELIG